MSDFESSVNGWKQAVGIIRKLRDGLDFALAEIEAASKANPEAFAKSAEKAQRFYDAQTALNTANRYVAAMDKAGAG